MKKNIISMILLLGLVAFNAGMLCKARCVTNHKEKQINSTATAETVLAVAICTIHHNERDALAEGGHSHSSGTGIKCGCGIDDTNVHLDFNFNFVAVDLSPKDLAVSAVMMVDSIFTSLTPVPQDRPPKLFV